MSRGYSSRLIPFVLLALGPGLAFPSSLVPWIRGDYNLGLLITSDLLVIAGAVLVVWGVVRLKETDRLPWPAIGLLLVHYVAMTNIEFMLPIEWPASVEWVWQSVGFVSIGALVGLGLILGLAFLAVRVLRRIKGPSPPALGPAPPPTPELVLPPDEWLEPAPSAPRELPKLRADRMFGMPLKAEDPVKEEPCEP